MLRVRFVRWLMIGSAFALFPGCGAPAETVEDESIGTEQSAVSRTPSWFFKGNPSRTRKLTYCVDGSLYSLTDDGEIWRNRGGNYQNTTGYDSDWTRVMPRGFRIDEIACGNRLWFLSDRRIYRNDGSATSFVFKYMGYRPAAKHFAVSRVGQGDDSVWVLHDDGSLWYGNGTDTSWKKMADIPQADRISGGHSFLPQALFRLDHNKDLFLGSRIPYTNQMQWTFVDHPWDAVEIAGPRYWWNNDYEYGYDFWQLTSNRSLYYGYVMSAPDRPPPPPTPPPPPPPQFWSVGIPIIHTCTPDLSDCGYFPRRFDSFRLMWHVCNGGTIASPAFPSYLYETYESVLQDVTDVSVPSIPPGMCVQRMTESFSISSPGYWHWDVYINNEFKSGTGETFF
jgi:hypothetical protein